MIIWVLVLVLTHKKSKSKSKQKETKISFSPFLKGVQEIKDKRSCQNPEKKGCG